jgi:arylsulfatase A-like enzyme
MRGDEAMNSLSWIRSRGNQAVVMTALLLSLSIAHAQSADGPDSRRVLPPSDQPFAGRIGNSVKDSVPSWPARLEAPAGAPNILLIMTDDVGFGASSTFGGPIPTPTLDRLARDGLRYNRFHTTALCSPSRAALLTGRNHHHVGAGRLADVPLGFPGYDAVFPRAAVTIAKTLNMNGYSTAMFGKHHNASPTTQTLAGPFDTWPTGLGFDYFYGFMGGDSSWWTPRLFRNVSPVDEPAPSGKLLGERLVDDAVRWIHNQKAGSPNRPFFLYFADPSMHAPHHAPVEWIARFKGQFNQGWDEVRKETYQRQLKAGIIPPGTELTPRPADLPAWSSLSARDRETQAHMMEVAAAELSFEDQQLGRLIGELDRMGLRDNTLIVFIEGDNGASAEAGLTGTTNELGSINGTSPDTPEQLHQAMPTFGGPLTYGNYSVAWGWAMDSPLPRWKAIASHLGGMTNGVVISWPRRIHGSAIRSQFTHLVDIAPTLLDAAGIPAPVSVDGIRQEPFDGISLLPTFDSNAPLSRTQYFEMYGNIGLYHDGWFANTTPQRPRWSIAPAAAPGSTAGPRRWELYDLEHDFSQSHDVAAQFPARLKELQDIFDAEARRNEVYPIPEGTVTSGPRSVDPARAGRQVYDYWGADTTVLRGTAPWLGGRSFTVTAEVAVKDRTSGVIVADGSRFGGWSFFLDQGRPVFVHALSEKPGGETRIASAKALPPGAHRLQYVFASEGTGGLMRIEADGALVAEGRVPVTAQLPAGPSETFDTGHDSGVPVTSYRTPEGRFEGTIAHVRISFSDLASPDRNATRAPD